MRNLKKITLLLGVILLIVTGFATYKLLHKPTAPTIQVLKQTATIPSVAKPITETADDFSYTIPTDWAKLSQNTITKMGAEGAIARTKSPFAQFSIDVASPPQVIIPTNDKELTTYIQTFINRFPNHKLIKKSTVTVGGIQAQQYVYSYGADSPTTQEFIGFVHNKHAFSLLFTCATSDFSGLETSFNTILGSFKIK